MQWAHWAGSSDQGGHTEVKELRPGGHHYWEENSHRHSGLHQLTCPHQFRLILVESVGQFRQNNTVFGCWGHPRASGVLQGLFRGSELHGTASSPKKWIPETEASWSQRRQTLPQRIKGIFFLFGLGSVGGLCIINWKTKEKPLHINMLKRDHS